ncbi:MAG: lipoyl protein ligase domain-containing protein [Rubrobacter sp.]
MNEGSMDLLLPGRFLEAAHGYGFQRTVFDQVARGERPPTLVITPSTRHVSVTRRDTHRPGFRRAVAAANDLGFPVFVRGAGGGATAADAGTFGFSLVRPSSREGSRHGIASRYEEASKLALAAFSRLGIREVEVGEVRDEFCPGDNSLRVGGYKDGMKVCGIAQRLTSRATSVGGIVLVRGHEELSRVLAGVYGEMELPFRPGSVGSLERAGYDVSVDRVVRAFAAEGAESYGARPAEVDKETLSEARRIGAESRVSFSR